MSSSLYRAPAFAPGSPRLQTQREKAIGVVGAESSRFPLVVLFHGLQGKSRSHSSLTLMSGVASRGWRGVVVDSGVFSGVVTGVYAAHPTAIWCRSTQVNFLRFRL